MASGSLYIHKGVEKGRDIRTRGSENASTLARWDMKWRSIDVFSGAIGLLDVIDVPGHFLLR